MKKLTAIMLGAILVCTGAAGLATPEAYGQDKSAKEDSILKGLQLRVRGLAVIPQESADISVIGGDVDIDTSYVPELDISYFFTENIAVELILAVTPHDVTATNTSIGNVDLGSVWLLPPTLLLQYHHPFKGGFKPYVGAGLNYTVFFDEDAPGGTVQSIDYENSVGYALQFGMDYMLNENWLINVDVKKLFLSTDVKINGGAINADVDIDPWIVGVGLGYRF
ncbi:MAG: OmpW family protein [Alphaproteobacteria bacterium]|nr:OmpW family protein [Alphaproteobacteria bacterium]